MKPNMGKWRVRKGPMGEWLLYAPGKLTPFDSRVTFEKALYFFPIVASKYKEEVFAAASKENSVDSGCISRSR